MLKLTIGSLLLLAIFVCTVSLCEAKTVSLRHSHHKDGALTIIIDMGGEGKKSKETKETKTKETKETEETKPKLDDTTKDIVAQVSKAISKEEEKKLAESLLTLGNELTQIAKLIPGKDSEQKLLRDQLLSVASEMAKEAEKPSFMILQSSMAMVVQDKQNQQNAAADSSSSSSGAQTMFIGAAIEGLSLGMNAIDGIGTYSTSVSKIGQWVKGKAADKLDKWGLQSAASIARNTGKSIDGFAQKVAPYETKLAAKIAPVVKSKTFQGIKRVANVVGGALSIHAGVKFLGMSAATKLPKTFSAIKSSITKAAKVVANKGGIVRKIAATGLKAKKAATQSLNQFSTFRKVNAAVKASKAAKAAKNVGHAAHAHSKFKTAVHHAHAGYEIYSGSSHVKHGLLGHHGGGHGSSGHGSSGHGSSGHGSSSGHGASSSKHGASSGHGSSSSRKSSGHSSSSSRSSSSTRKSTGNSGSRTSRTSSTRSSNSGRSSSTSGRSSTRSSSSSRQTRSSNSSRQTTTKRRGGK